MKILDIIGYERKLTAICADWRARHKKVHQLNPGYKSRAPADVEKEHQRIWGKFGRHFSFETLRICHGISGKANVEIVPEEIFAADIDRVLNKHEWHAFLSHKSLYKSLYPTLPFPESYLHCLGGSFFDKDFNPITAVEARKLIDEIPYPLVFKPNTGSGGGAGVSFPSCPEELWSKSNSYTDYLVQPLLRQHSSFKNFNPTGLNTLRVYTYRSVVTDEVHVLNVALRMGINGSLDNETAGGIVCFIHENGQLNDYAVDKYAVKFFEHPDSHLKFGRNFVIPDVSGLHDICKKMSRHIPHVHLMGWDMFRTDQNEWRCLEVNLAGHTTRFAQYAGVSFFGKFTNEVIDYCFNDPRHKSVVRKMY